MLVSLLLRRGILFAALAFGLIGRAQTASTAPAAEGPVPLPVADPSGFTATWSASTGWRENVMLSPYAPNDRAFGRTEVEALYLAHRDEWQFTSFLNGDVLRYFSAPPETSGEAAWFARGEVRWQHWKPWRLALKLDGFLQDAVFDLSEAEAVRTVARLRVRGAIAGLVPRLTLPGGFEVEPLFQVRRTDYRTFAGDYDEARHGLRLHWQRWEWLGAEVSWHEHRRSYAERQNYTLGGRALAGTHLRFEQHVGAAKLTSAWQAAGEWTAELKGERLQNRDNGSGFFNYDQDGWGGEVGFRHQRWNVTSDYGARRLVYLNQTVGTGIAPPSRRSDSREAGVKIERELSDRWTIFLQHRWERTDSNEPGFSYATRTTSGGVQRSF
jgi:hypothetical protein